MGIAHLAFRASGLVGGAHPTKTERSRRHDQAVAYADCEVRSTVDVGSHTLFLGEVVDAAFQKDEDSPVLRMEDTRMNYGG